MSKTCYDCGHELLERLIGEEPGLFCPKCCEPIVAVGAENIIKEVIKLQQQQLAAECSKIMLGRLSYHANRRGCTIAEVGLTSEQIYGVAMLQLSGKLPASNVNKLVDALIDMRGMTEDQIHAYCKAHRQS